MTGGAGNDTYVVDNVGDRALEGVGGGTDTIWASAGYTLAAGSEVEIMRANAGATGLTLTGNEFANTLVGGTGNDTLNGGGGNDTLSGKAGADVMTGGAGNDVYTVDDAGDVVLEGISGGTDTVWATVNYVLTAGSEVEFLRANAGATGLTLTGNALANTLVGGTGNDTLNGGGGNDTLSGNAGADVMTGGAGNDTYAVDNVGDRALEGVGGGTDTIWAAVDHTLAAGSEIEFLRNAGATGLTLTGNEFANTVVGNGGNDTLLGGAGNDILNGRAGNDVLTGGAGDDTMTGGTETDIFKFSTGFGHDIITDFDSNPVGGQDLLDISALGIKAATFAGSVNIAASGSSTLVSIGVNSIRLSGVVAGTIDSTDFRLAA
jgi:serralysin